MYEYGLTEEQIRLIQARCNAIIEEFEPNEIYEYPATMYVVSTYNSKYPNETISGDIYEYAMSVTFEAQAPQVQEA